MLHKYATSTQPDELNLLAQLFEEELDRRQLPRDVNAAEELAARIIELYRSGVRDIGELRAVITGS